MGIFDDALSPGVDDAELARVARWIGSRDVDGSRFGFVLRAAFDEALDGARTGRFDPIELRKVEKTFIGTRVELGVSREFDLPDGIRMDFSIDGVDVDAKYSRAPFGWQMPPEAMGHLCLVIWSDDHRSRFSVGLVRVEPDRLGAPNRDGKSPLNAAGRDAIRWIHRERELPENLLLHLDPHVREAIFRPRSGQAKVDELFRRVQNRIVWREAVVTVARQLDAARRVRTAREQGHLGGEGIVVLGHYEAHRAAAHALGLPVPRSGEWISTRLARVDADDPRARIILDGTSWGIAIDGDVVVPAPALPHDIREIDS